MAWRLDPGCVVWTYLLLKRRRFHNDPNGGGPARSADPIKGFDPLGDLGVAKIANISKRLVGSIKGMDEARRQSGLLRGVGRHDLNDPKLLQSSMNRRNEVQMEGHGNSWVSGPPPYAIPSMGARINGRVLVFDWRCPCWKMYKICRGQRTDLRPQPDNRASGV